MKDRVVLIGLPGAGKSTVGPLLAARLGWRFTDVDEEITRRTGRTVAGLFRTEGEPAFRALERDLTAALSSVSHRVLAPGGGWAVQPGALDALPPEAATVWLRVSPAEAIRRLRGSPVIRPLLAAADPLAALEALAGQRHDIYARADLTVDADGEHADHIADTIAEWLKRSTS